MISESFFDDDLQDRGRTGVSRSREINLDRALGALLGLAVGDALGAALEFSKRDSHPEVRDIIGGGPFNLKPGEWTDDTSMALCLADSLIARRTFDPLDLMRRFVLWWREGENSVTGRCFDIGVATREALTDFHRTGKLAGVGRGDPNRAGNGSLMRLAPVALFAAPDPDVAATLAELQSKTTHPAVVCQAACAFFARLLVEAIAGGDKEEVLRDRKLGERGVVGAIAAGAWKSKTRETISSSGYVVSTLEAALWAVGRSDCFEEALILAVNLGGDADTVGAVAGQLAGAIWGRRGIPPRWLEKIAWRQRIEERAMALLEAGKRPPRATPIGLISSFGLRER
ncbi:ADP-ribosylglycohydrolase family protein [Methylocella tundrae]|uniref:ADP-ribosyl-[dinitrogen reductase] hydrolase n=1 Tax=Methylocella tundrae TaxID=227605 RepID=A0A4U8YZN2_METTU